MRNRMRTLAKVSDECVCAFFDPSGEVTNTKTRHYLLIDDLLAHTVRQSSFKPVAYGNPNPMLMRSNEKYHAVVIGFPTETPAVAQITSEVGNVPTSQ